jgi:hypothetical protein
MEHQADISLDELASDIRRIGRNEIFSVGALLLKAKAKCEHGRWLTWLDQECGLSVKSAERSMSAVRLAATIVKLTNLKLEHLSLPKTVIHRLVELGDDDLAVKAVKALEAALRERGGKLSANDALCLIDQVLPTPDPEPAPTPAPAATTPRKSLVSKLVAANQKAIKAAKAPPLAPVESAPAAQPIDLQAIIAALLKAAREPVPSAIYDAFSAEELADASRFLSDLARIGRGKAAAKQRAHHRRTAKQFK